MVGAREIGTELLERWALGYLGRYASSAENLRRVLMRRVRRHAPEAVQPARPLIEAILTRYREAGLLDDAAYAAARATSLHRRGGSLMVIRTRLMAKGVAGEVVASAVGSLQELGPDPDLAAACAFARRRRLGPFRRAAADRARELAAFARAGFGRRIAEAVLACADEEAVAALARDGLG
jgi:regulatory protein